MLWGICGGSLICFIEGRRVKFSGNKCQAVRLRVEMLWMGRGIA